MMSRTLTIRNVLQCIHSLLTLTFVSICLFILSILTYLMLRKHLLPSSHVIIPLPLGFPLTNLNRNDLSNQFPSHLFSHVNLTDKIDYRHSIDLSRYTYQVEIDCRCPRSYRNRQLGSFFIHLLLYSNSNQLIVEHSRFILFPYQSEIIRLIRIFLSLPLTLLRLADDQWNWKEILIERLHNEDKTKNILEQIHFIIYPSTLQIDQCQIHFYILDLTGLAYSFVHYPYLTGCLSICVLFSIYITFYLIITGLTLLNSSTNKIDYYSVKDE